MASSTGLDSVMDRDPAFLSELWAWCGLGTTAMILRLAVRIRMVGFRGFKGDDYATIMTMASHTAVVVLVDLVYRHGTNLDVAADQVNGLSDDEVDRLVWGSIYQEAAWYAYTAFLWCLKATMMFFYHRLTFGMWQYEWVLSALSWFTTISYIAVVLTVTFSCIPFEDNWRVRPPPPESCSFKPQNLIVTTVFNVLTDAAILCLPLPVLRELRVPLYKKILVAILICSGIFVISAAIMRLALTMSSAPSTITINRWGMRECEIGIMAVNAPVIRPLFKRSFWRRRKSRRSSNAPPRTDDDPEQQTRRTSATGTVRSGVVSTAGTAGSAKTTTRSRKKELRVDDLLGWTAIGGDSSEDDRALEMQRGKGTAVIASAEGHS